MSDLYGTTSKKSLIAALAIAGVIVFLFLVGLGVMLWCYFRAKPGSQIDALYPRDVESTRTFIPSSTTAIAGWNEKAPSTATGSSEGSLEEGSLEGGRGGGQNVEAPQVAMSRHSSASDTSQNLNGLRPVEPAAIVR
ncbi:unnamed protein product [Tuber melanosporum]|uniref:(Perigord truffle) hypothetical protein n=1 Tax=Tuber melanosporum (strain Mel28) TaxID=656061 RepID=D5GQ12_TUBMM|nr:uncharacterized protein GSTUM_00012128001 [Tuber melanosporum]CAZ86605.1 unnamed protein product [Tuber melanosporum]